MAIRKRYIQTTRPFQAKIFKTDPGTNMDRVKKEEVLHRAMEKMKVIDHPMCQQVFICFIQPLKI